ncbi:MAG: phosphate/phosphite/phosphonate ABC transporter substrate-binding protein [Azoarcus sp.]|nr:phosphate/phosphite/phosphonate ABC transporter substrate-binding protein [Azoarcus sp.]
MDWKRLLLGTIMLLVAGLAAAESGTLPSPLTSDGGLRLGIVPFASTSNLLKIHRPLRDHLAQTLRRQVMVYTSTSHERFLDDALSGHFDVVVTTAHFLPMLVDDGFVPLVRYRNTFDLVLVVHKNSAIHGIGDLRGRRIGLPDRLSFYHIVGLQWLHTIGMEAGRDYTLSEQPSHRAELMAVALGRIDVAITGFQALLQLDEDTRSQLRPIQAGTLALPSMTTLAHGSLGKAKVAEIQAALLSFPQSGEGARFFETTGYGGYVPATMGDIENARPYEAIIRRFWSGRTDHGDDIDRVLEHGQ